MQTASPPISRVVTMVLFALSCVGLLLFLWLSFGGQIPFNVQGYRFKAVFPNAFQLATEADVRVAGVPVGKVLAKTADPRGGGTIVTMEMDNKYAPLHRDARAILRQKTLLGETYVQVTPGTPRSPPIPDGGVLSRTQVLPAVQLDEIFNAFDPTTRHAFQVWQQELANAVRGNDQNLNDVLGNLPTFAADFTDLLRVLDVQHLAVVRLVQNGGTTFAALSRDPAALRTLITAGDTTFRTTAANNNALAQVFQIFPTFLTEQRLTMARLKSFSLDADPVIKELIPVAQQLAPTLNAVRQLAPPLRNLFENLGPLITVSQKGLPATAEVLRGLEHVGCGHNCLLGALGPFLEELNPVLSWLSLHQQLMSDFLSDAQGGINATTTTFAGNGVGHYLRQFSPNGPETLSFVPQRNPDNRGNVYPEPLWLPSGEPLDFTKNNLPAWDCKNTGGDHDVQSGFPNDHPACWTQPKLPGAPGKYLIPRIHAARYSSH